jgi:steroid delta-isomerase-like uncharacterized protein
MADNVQGAKSIHELLEQVRAGTLSRRGFVAALTALGVTAAGATTVLASATNSGKRAAKAHGHIELHRKHISNQMAGNTSNMMADYADHAVVDDPLFAQSFSGKVAIAERYAAEVASVPDRALRVLNRTATGNQLIIEWEATGTHTAPFMGFGGKGLAYTLRGTTVQTRENGKIVRESHFYDVAKLLKQIEG